MQSNLHNDKRIAKTISNINNRLYNIKKFGSHTQIKSRIVLIKAIVIGKLNYALPLLCNSTRTKLSKLNTLITKSCRVIMGSPCLKWTSSRLLNKCKLQTIWHMITEQGLTYIHKIQTTQTPLAIYEIYDIPTRPKRTNVHIYPKYTPKTNLLKNSFFYKFSKIYANLPDTLKISSIKKFKTLSS